MLTLNDYAGLKPAWCPGCGNYGILTALKKALLNLNLAPHQVLIVSGIGQAGKIPHYLRCNTFNSLHGRSLPVAIGAKIANHRLTVIAAGGDGDGYGEGGNHWLHAMRRNHDITYIVHNNGVYALTRGQISPTRQTPAEEKTQIIRAVQPINPVAIAVASNASFIARGFAGDIEHLADLIKQGILHKGFSFIDILQPCVSFNKVNTHDWYSKRVYKLETLKSYDPYSKTLALEKAEEWGDRIPIGIFYIDRRAPYEDCLSAIARAPLVNQNINPLNIEKLLDSFS